MGDNTDNVTIALLQRDYEQTAQIVSKMDTAIEKLTGLGNDMTKMLALHEQRINRLEQVDNEVQILVEKRRNELQDDIKDLDGKVSTALKETEQRIMQAIKDVKVDIKADLDADAETKQEEFKGLAKRVSTLEKWRWMMLGGGFVIGFIIEKILPLLLPHVGG
jgi:hypothetical protein